MSRISLLLASLSREAASVQETVVAQNTGAVPDVDRMEVAFGERATVGIRSRDNGLYDVVLKHPLLGTSTFATKVSPSSAEDMARSLAALHDAEYVGYITDSTPPDTRPQAQRYLRV